MARWAYRFHESSVAMRNLLGGKDCNLTETTNLGTPIPQGLAITTEACIEYYDCGKQISQEIQDQIFEVTTWLEGINGKKLGGTEDPLLVSVHSGIRASMFGMMNAILNLRLNDAVVEGLAKKTGNPRFTYDSYHRSIQMYSDVVMEVPESYFEKIIDEMKEAKGVHFDTDLTADDLRELAIKSKAAYEDVMDGEESPQNPTEQLTGAVRAVLRSQSNPHTIVCCRMSDIPGDWGAAVDVQTMVFGNKGETPGTGVASTHNPSTGAKGIYGEYLVNTQGEDVVASIRTPQPISELAGDLPECYKEFVNLAIRLGNHFYDTQDTEFTIEEGKLYFLQTRNGKRTALVAIQTAYDLVDEGMITPEEAVYRIEAKSLDRLLHPTFVPEALKAGEVIGSALPASLGTAAGKIYFMIDEAKDASKGGRGERVILIRLETSPGGIEGMHAAQGIPTVRGGMTSYAIVVARGMRTCCTSGYGGIKINGEAKVFELSGHIFHEGDYISLDGSTGKIYKSDIATQEATVGGNFEHIMEWADQSRTLCVRANTDTPADTLNTVKLGAEGIGLYRTEHMFSGTERILKIRKAILSETVEQREEALNELIPFQKGGFKAMYKVLEGRLMTVRYLDPPLYEFVPIDPEDIKALADDMGMTVEAVNAKCAELHEFSPMMGHCGCRLAVTYPEIAKIQTRVIMEAVVEVKEECGYDIIPEIMIPLIGEKKELKCVRGITVEIAELVKKEKNSDTQCHIGTTIEIPRTAPTVDKVTEEADFFSFGTDGLTQMTFGFLRDDIDKLLDSYYKAKIYESDPFARLNQEGVGQLAKMAVEKGRSIRVDLKYNIRGERGGDLSSVELCHKIGLNYVPYSPFRVPIARLAAAQATLNNKQAVVYPVENDSYNYQCLEILCGQVKGNRVFTRHTKAETPG